MKHSIYVCCLCLLSSVMCASEYRELKASLSRALDERISLSKGLDGGRWSVQKGEEMRQAKKEIIDLSDALSGKGTSPILERILEEYGLSHVPKTVSIEVLSGVYTPDLYNLSHSLNNSFEIALARLGYEEAFGNILKGLDTDNSDMRSRTFTKLARIRTEASLSILGEFLLGNHEKEFPAKDAPPGHVIGYSSSEVLAMSVLGIEFGKQGLDPREAIGQDILVKWQEWWKQGEWKSLVYSEIHDSELFEPELIASSNYTPKKRDPVSIELTSEHSEPIEEDAEKRSQWWLWLIGAVVVIGGFGLVLRRKS